MKKDINEVERKCAIDGNVFSHNCSRCGKSFVRAPYHVYVLPGKIYCSYTCWMRARDEKEAAHRARIEARRDRKKKKGSSGTTVDTVKGG